MTTEIRKLVVLSTAHVSADTAVYLAQIHPLDWGFVGGNYGDYGWFFYCHEENAGVPPIPDDLFAVMKWARERHGADNLLLDQDGDTTDELLSYEW